MNMLSDVHESLLDLVYTTVSPSKIKHFFFAPAHVSRKNVCETTFIEKLLNTRDLMFGSEPGGQSFLPYHKIYKNNRFGSFDKEINFTPGMLDVVTLGVLWIVPCFFVYVVAGSLVKIQENILDWRCRTQYEFLNRAASYLSFIPVCMLSICMLVPLTLFLAAILLHLILGCLLTIMASPLVLLTHIVSSIVHWLQCAPYTNKRSSLTPGIQNALTQLDSLIQSVGAHNRMEVTIQAKLLGSRCILAAVVDTAYQAILTQKTISSLDGQSIDCTDAFCSNPSDFLDQLRHYEARGLLVIEPNLSIAEICASSMPVDATLSHVISFF